MRRHAFVIVFTAFIHLAANATPDSAIDTAAIERSQMEPVRAVLKDGGDPNSVTNIGMTLLAVATNWNDLAAVEALISKGADPNNCGAVDSCPLFIAASRNTNILKRLLESGADPNRVTSTLGQTPLVIAAGTRSDTFSKLRSNGRYRGPATNSAVAIRLLLQAGANVNHVNEFGESPLRVAIRVNNLSIARSLIEANADVHQRIQSTQGAGQRGATILMEACGWSGFYKSSNSVRLLLESGANSNDQDAEPYSSTCEARGGCDWRGYSVLGYAAKHGLTEVVQLLLAHGADANIGRNDGTTALKLAEAGRHPKTTALIRMHLPAKAAL